jgi:hypothetical protein
MKDVRKVTKQKNRGIIDEKADYHNVILFNTVSASSVIKRIDCEYVLHM